MNRENHLKVLRTAQLTLVFTEMFVQNQFAFVIEDLAFVMA
jgi:hypothetical protein